MANYKKSKIYKITNLQNGLFYIGSTTRGISCRFKEHYKRSRKGTNKCMSAKVISGAKRKDIKIELLEVWPCANRRELEQREYLIINQAEPRDLCVNRAGRIIMTTPDLEDILSEIGEIGTDEVFLPRSDSEPSGTPSDSSESGEYTNESEC